MKLKIGEFARLGQISVQALRYYDDLGLIKPSLVDPFSGYRYYTLDQLPRLMRILALKDLGFSLEQVGGMLSDALPAVELRRLLVLKREELTHQVQDQLDRLERLDARLRLIEQEQVAPVYEVILKRIEPFQVASVRRVVLSYWDEGPLWGELFSALNASGLQPCGPCLTVYHSGEPEIDAEACAPIARDAVLTSASVQTRALPAVETAACTCHKGAYTGLITAYTALVRWIEANGYRMAGPDREIYLRLPEGCPYGMDENAVTELQVPVEPERG